MEESINTTEKIIAAIDRKKVTPRPKWYFVARNTVLWIPGIITTLLGAYTIAGVLYGIIHAHWENRQYVDSGPLVFIAVIPLLWVISFALFLVITMSLLRKTNRGYRHTALQILLISVASSIIMGILFYTLTANSSDNLGTYYRHPTQHQQEHVWDDPDDGRISGVIVDTGGTSLTLSAFNGVIWTVDITAVPSSTSTALLQKGNAIRIVGIPTSTQSFTACRVLEWELFPAQPSTLLPVTLEQQPVSCDDKLRRMNIK